MSFPSIIAISIPSALRAGAFPLQKRPHEAIHTLFVSLHEGQGEKILT